MTALSLPAKFILIFLEKYVVEFNVGIIDKKLFFKTRIEQYIKCEKTFQKYLSELEDKRYINIQKDENNLYNKNYLSINKPSSFSKLDQEYHGIITLVVPSDCYVIVKPNNQNITYKLEYPTNQYLIFKCKAGLKIKFNGANYRKDNYQHSFKNVINERIA